MDLKFSNQKRVYIQEKLLSWYDQAKRDLPWRRHFDAYRIVVSELMLQQTQVNTVIPYYNRFIKRFPGFQSLAEASVQDVLKLWEGLGYYRRARLLKKMAEFVHLDLAGCFPQTYSEMLKLPGIGPYTAAAISSIVFSEPVGVVDGNVYRVFSRVFDLDWDISLAPCIKCYRELASQLVSKGRPGDFNQAVMELGATVCTPRNPDCGICVLNAVCSVRNRDGDPKSRPVKTKRPRIRKEAVNCLWVQQGTGIYLRQRPDRGMLAGMWELPICKGQYGEPVLEIVHRYTHVHTTYRVYSSNQMEPDSEGHWVAFQDMLELPMTGAFVKIRNLMAPKYL